MGMLSGKVAIVTGASSGIGYAAATLFAREGGRVVAAAPRQGELDGLLEGIVQQGGVALALVGDVRDEDYAQALVDMAVARFGGLDVAFNNAGTIGSVGAVQNMSIEAWKHTCDSNLTSAFLGAEYRLPAMLVDGGVSVMHT